MPPCEIFLVSIRDTSDHDVSRYEDFLRKKQELLADVPHLLDANLDIGEYATATLTVNGTVGVGKMAKWPKLAGALLDGPSFRSFDRKLEPVSGTSQLERLVPAFVHLQNIMREPFNREKNGGAFPRPLWEAMDEVRAAAGAGTKYIRGVPYNTYLGEATRARILEVLVLQGQLLLSIVSE